MDLFKEALEIAAKERAGAMSPEIARRMQESMMRRGMAGAAAFPAAGAESAGGAAQQLAVGPQMPPGFIDPIYKSALAQLDLWMTRNERYRNQGEFARLESVFEAIKEALG